MTIANIIDPKDMIDGLATGMDVFPFSYFWKALEQFHRTGTKPWPVHVINVGMAVMIINLHMFALTATATLDLTVANRAGSSVNPIFGLQMLYKLWALNKYANVYFEMLQLLRKDYIKSIPAEKSEAAHDVRVKSAMSANKLIRVAVGMNAVLMSAVVISPIVNSPTVRGWIHLSTDGKITKILYNEYRFDWTVSPTYEFVFVYELFCATSGVFMGTLYQVVLLLFVTALVTHIKVLHYTVSSLKKSDFTKSTERKLNDDEKTAAYIQLVECAKDHQRLNEAGKVIADSFDFFLTLQLPTSVLIIQIGVICFIMSTSTADYMRSCGSILFALLELSFYCYLGQMLENASDDFSRHVYNCEWDEMSPEFRKVASLMLARTHHPICLRAGRIYRLNIDTLSGILQLMCSSYTGFSKLMSS